MYTESMEGKLQRVPEELLVEADRLWPRLRMVKGGWVYRHRADVVAEALRIGLAELEKRVVA